MVKLSYKVVNGVIIEVVLTGHAGFSSKGSDIVCSAISSIVYGTISFLKSNFPQDKNLFNLEIKKGFVKITFNNNEEIKDDINEKLFFYSLKMMIHQLKNISFYYNQHLIIYPLISNDL